MTDTSLKRAENPARDWLLVVDDDAPIRNVMAQFLEETGVEVVGADSGLAALEILDTRSTEPIVVFVDVLMPGMDGLTLSRKLRAKLKRTTLVIMSGHMTDLSWWPVDLREVTFLAKPFRLSEITEIVTAAQAGFRR
jgi:two-component system, cell cycle sensor histidine kinase and response regulator CckA